MSGKRSTIRTAVRDRIAAAVAYSVFASRDIDAREEVEFANVYFTDGVVEYAGLQRQTESNLEIAYRNKDELEDDFIDDRGDEIQAAIESAPFGDEMSGILYVGFEYLDERERGFGGITLRFMVNY